MRPLLLKGHTRPLTFIKYNVDGDILISCAKDHRPTLWYADTGERIGTYKGHNGATWSCDITRDSKRLVTASADSTVKLWNLTTGECIFTFKFDIPCRSVSFSLGEEYLLLTTDAFMGTPPAVRILKHSRDIEEQQHEEVLCISDAHPGRITRAMWGPLNKTFVTSCEDGMVRKFDAASGKLLNEVKVHEKSIQMMDLDSEGNTIITASLDKKSVLLDFETFDILKTYQTDRPLNTAAISPLKDHIALGGGQDAASVTTTAGQAGKFEVVFYHKIFQEMFGTVRGHFGPLNFVAFSPNGKSFTTGGEDGYVRIHHLDSEYFDLDL
ncbi:subunit I of translation initiation factor 3 [Chloropicon primus]|uniref:Eukaryotic translation initiation factor 3 subunit I n=1 Tax=Chloropicon primus TaxID=1764295 RepID=A0A5B8MY19_9CHLO|nr:subunit I of translation initiation factor 3 [Chloropicon primus]UPR03753.1 subunit I of translation initiation factor 3 [Chloropicon primus]|eukprot:QDZ24545.1 subunit I of translation initiation factor 3 [Chloropicon primus]